MGRWWGGPHCPWVGVATPFPSPLPGAEALGQLSPCSSDVKCNFKKSSSVLNVQFTEAFCARYGWALAVVWAAQESSGMWECPTLPGWPPRLWPQVQPQRQPEGALWYANPTQAFQGSEALVWEGGLGPAASDPNLSSHPQRLLL